MRAPAAGIAALCLALCLAPTPASAEPISAIIGLTALLETAFGASIGIGFGTITAGQLGGLIVGVGLSVGLSYAAQLLTKKKLSASNQDAGKFNERQSIPVKRIILGETKVGGALFFEEVKPPYLYIGFLLCDDKIDGISKMWIGTKEVPFTQIIEHWILTPAGRTGNPNYPARLRVCFAYGDDNHGVDPIIAAAFPNIGAEFRQRGIARAVCRFDWGADQDEYTALWGQVQRPSPFWQARGIAVYDPRDPTQDIDDASTWKFTKNPTLHAFHYARSEYGGRLYADIYDWDIAKICASADWDDAPVAVKGGGFIPRYTCSGVYTLDQTPADVLASILSSNRDKLIDRGGRLWIASAAPKSPVVTVHDGLLMNGFEYQRDKPKRDMANRGKTRFVAADREYQVVDGPMYIDDDWLAEDGEPLDQTYDYPFTDDHRVVQRMTKAQVAESRLGRALVCRCGIVILAHCADELIDGMVKVSSNLFPWINGDYIATKVTIDPAAAAVDLVLAEYDPAIETDWDPETDERDFELPAVDVS